MFRIVKWEFPTQSAPYMFSTELVIGNHIMFSKLQAEGLQFSISGLGLTKAEREIFNCKRFKMLNTVNIYIGKLIITFDRRGYKDHMRSVKITYDQPLLKGNINKK